MTLDDMASEREEQFREAALQERAHNAAKVQQQPSSICLDCDEPIPGSRKQAIPSCYLCIECANWREAWKKH